MGDDAGRIDLCAKAHAASASAVRYRREAQWKATAVPIRPTGPMAAATAREPLKEGREEPECKADEGDAFDRWLHCRLQQTYGAIAREPIPEELLRIIEESRKA